ncbi:hypothetical protein LTR70_000250 [Exophiala xenobiotica]|uniref:F-box domain-containing protein n=1 Tax=Lithohypha guttulata TaxID=1690604 RepID=A0ABR0K5X5_9EURO|nr:hypothetical protein LTR24_007042 [Lithohypha guttulata]KAK5330928.1 hypothetical protein LTR70_000250 [Exophiala xenobiotica]
MMRIRGKRNHREAPKDLRASRTPGRPSKVMAQLAAVQKKVILGKLQRYHIEAQRKMDRERDKLSALERLPVELIQQIFFHALEVNLPRASNYLRQVLSTEQIFNSLIVFAYFDDDGEGPVEAKHFLPADYRMLNCEEKLRLQQGVFTCRWCTHELIELCLPSLSRLVMAQAWHKEHVLDQSHDQGTVRMHVNNVVVPNEAIRGLAPLPSLDEEAKLEQHYFAKTTTENLGSSISALQHDATAFLPRIITWTSSLDDQGIVHKSTDRSQTILAARHIPDWLLLSTPWTSEQLQLLQLLRQGYTFIQYDHVMNISAKAVFEGMRNAISESNIAALTTLLEIHNVFFKSGAWTFQYMMAVQLTPASHHPLPLDLFHLAARQDSRATQMISLLLRAGIDSLPADDEVITAWAVHGLQQGNLLASWLLKHMEGTASYGLPRRGHLFVDGCLSWRARAYDNFPFPRTSFATELGYIAGTPIVPAGLNGAICGSDEGG